MKQPPVFTITYWGVTGTFSDPLTPAEVTGKIVQAIRCLIEKERLQGLQAGPGLEAKIEELLREELPFHARSSYGGNTTCVEVQTSDALFIIDCGSGYREFGVALDARWNAPENTAERSAHVLLTHSHMDHTMATPFFAPYYNPANTFTLYGSKVTLDSLSAVLDPESALSKIYFPPTYDMMQALHEFRPLVAGAVLQIGSTRVSTHGLHHPGGSIAYRLENAGRVFVFASDHEQQQVPDPGLVEFARGADLLYTEGQYTRAEYEGRVGVGGEAPMSREDWGHSPVEDCVKTALAAEVRNLHIGHRDPLRGDRQIAEFEEYLRRLIRDELRVLDRPAESCQACVPFEGMQISI